MMHGKSVSHFTVTKVHSLFNWYAVRRDSVPLSGAVCASPPWVIIMCFERSLIKIAVCQKRQGAGDGFQINYPTGLLRGVTGRQRRQSRSSGR